MIPNDPDQPVDASKVDDPYGVTPRRSSSLWHIDPETGYFGLLSPPGTPPVTSEDVKRLLEDFP
jgi:hypothetical protein